MTALKLDSLPTKRKIDWVDYTKGIGIFLVVLGHTLGGLRDSSILESSQGLKLIVDWIYAFHMALFFFISGLFVQRSLSTKPFRDFVSSKIAVIVYPYFLWSILQSLLQIFGSRYANTKIPLSSIWKIVYNPVMQFWFLYSLFIIFVLYGIAYKLKVSPVIFFIGSTLVSYLDTLGVNFGDWSVLEAVIHCSVYFSLGVIFGSSTLMLTADKVNTYMLILISLSGYLAVALAVKLQINQNYFFTPIIAFIGISASIAMGILLSQLNVASFIKKWGLLSLEIFLAHVIFTSVFRLGLYKIFNFTEPITHIVLGTIIGLYAPIALAIICRRVGFKYMFTLQSRH
ncbi:MAG: acyltransferase family protein [Nostoc sp. DedVER02]|uniref:acyltransferase family protein n=1 Tax=unclassified Nostoc TaxID=2593658 RepID=UPI002AD20EF6|nr:MULTISPECIES: acyltransferase family protein [unclassified Nostoc]MDZ7990474.1 acyltransferase family protein [Nostoc sp. DedVER02]MDZ8115834.1 acyltransferase family protein [Nostoc sp. DedVER01b]